MSASNSNASSMSPSGARSRGAIARCTCFAILGLAIGVLLPLPLAAQQASESSSRTLVGGQGNPAGANYPGLGPTDWPWWRGPQRNGWAALVSSGTRPLPIRFGANENVLWKAMVPGRGHSSPIVVGRRVFLATADEVEQVQSVLAFDLESGDLLWAREVSRGGFPARNHPKNTEASSTLASDGRQLYVTFFHDKQVELTSLGLDGEIRWQRSVGPFHPKKYEYGYAPSPVLYQQSVIVSVEHDGASSIAAFDRREGSELWRTARPANISFSSPVVAHVAGRDQLLISGSEKVASYDPRDGKLLWSVKGTTSATCGTMIWNDEMVFASGGFPVAQTIAVKADGSGQVAWENNQKCYEQSMIHVDGYIYALTDKGVLYCWRSADGMQMWRQRLSGPVSASPVYANKHIYWANEAGTIYVFRPNPDRFQLVAENRLGDEAFASPAVTGGRMLLRIAEGRKPERQEFLYCVGAQ